MKNIFKQKKGITLIALVITIIVLLILAGISISMLAGDNSILQKSTEAKTKTGIGQEKETIALAYNSALAKKVVNGNSSAVTDSELNDELDSNEATASGNPIIVTFIKSGNSYKIDSNGTIIPKSGQDIATVGINITEFSINPTRTQITNPTIPDGFYYVGGTVNSGYVISDNPNDESKYASNTNVGTDLQGNQFVWIPVVQNQKITLKVSSEDNLTSIKLYDPYGDEVNIGTASGKKFENTNIIPTINGLYKVQVTTENEEKEEFLIVRSLYAKNTFYERTSQEPTAEEIAQYSSDEFINQMLNDSPFNSKQELFEEFGNYMNKTITTNEEFGLAYADMVIFQNSADADYFLALKNNIIETEDYTDSINNYGGFYIGRYETCKENNNLVIQYNKDVWNNISQTNALSLAKSYDDNKTGITSSLLTGAAWDRTMGWLIESNDKTVSQIITANTSWGNYSNSIAKSGTTTKAVSNNIYDLSGNIGEWTTEIIDTYFAIERGGYFQNCYPVCSRSNNGNAYGHGGLNKSLGSETLGFRVALYL